MAFLVWLPSTAHTQTRPINFCFKISHLINVRLCCCCCGRRRGLWTEMNRCAMCVFDWWWRYVVEASVVKHDAAWPSAIKFSHSIRAHSEQEASFRHCASAFAYILSNHFTFTAVSLSLRPNEVRPAFCRPLCHRHLAVTSNDNWHGHWPCIQLWPKWFAQEHGHVSWS